MIVVVGEKKYVKINDNNCQQQFLERQCESLKRFYD